jgi:transposase
LPDPAVHQSIAVDLALLGHDAPLRRDLALASLTTATQHDAHTRSLRRTVPGRGESLRRVFLDAIHAIERFPRVPDVVSYCRLVTGAKDSAGKRYGTSGTQSGQASLTGAFSEAAGVLLRAKPAGQPSLTRLEKTPGKGQALTVLAHP